MEKTTRSGGGSGWTTRAEQEFLKNLPKLMLERRDRAVSPADLVITYKSYLASMAHRRWDGLDRAKIETTCKKLLGVNIRAADRDAIKRSDEDQE